MLATHYIDWLFHNAFREEGGTCLIFMKRRQNILNMLTNLSWNKSILGITHLNINLAKAKWRHYKHSHPSVCSVESNHALCRNRDFVEGFDGCGAVVVNQACLQQFCASCCGGWNKHFFSMVCPDGTRYTLRGEKYS